MRRMRAFDPDARSRVGRVLDGTGYEMLFEKPCSAIGLTRLRQGTRVAAPTCGGLL